MCCNEVLKSFFDELLLKIIAFIPNRSISNQPTRDIFSKIRPNPIQSMNESGASPTLIQLIADLAVKSRGRKQRWWKLLRLNVGKQTSLPLAHVTTILRLQTARWRRIAAIPTTDYRSQSIGSNDDKDSAAGERCFCELLLLDALDRMSCDVTVIAVRCNIVRRRRVDSALACICATRILKYDVTPGVYFRPQMIGT